MDPLAYLRETVTDGMELGDIVNAFERMCRIPIDDDMLLFETGTFTFTGEPMFYFSLVRQFHDEENEEEEYDQIHVDVLYRPSKENQAFSETVWNDELDGSIFDYVRASRAFACARDEDIVKVDVYQCGT